MKLPPRTVAVCSISSVFDRFVRERYEDTTTIFVHVHDLQSALGHRAFDAAHLDAYGIDTGHWEGWEEVRRRLITPYCDGSRHIIAYPYTRENLHRVARELGLRRHWFHASDDHPHYDMPLSRVEELTRRCVKVPARDLLRIVRGLPPPDPLARPPRRS